MQTITQRRGLRASGKISAGYNHDPAHYSFYRQTPRHQRNIPFDAPKPLTPMAFWTALAVAEIIALAVVWWVI